MESVLESALALAAKGWAVFPCDPETKSPLTPHGHLEATRGEEIIREWWTAYPDAMIGGKVPDSLLVLDIDPRNGGSVDDLRASLDPGDVLPRTLTVWSGRGDGGRHLYFQRPTHIERFTGARLPAGIDLKVNGYCIMPPSPHPATGRPYRWEMHDIATLPLSLRTLLVPGRPRTIPKGPGRDNTGGLLFAVRTASTGSRNAVLYWASCRARDAGASERVYKALVDAAMVAGLRRTEAERTVRSARGGGLPNG